ncbi:MAG: hypothetical protein WCJ58_07675 [bacterium]
MEKSKDLFAMKWDKVNLKLNGKVVKYSLLRIKIAGAPSLVEFVNFIIKIESFTEKFKRDYISLTDFSELLPNIIIERLISISSSRLIRSIIFVSNKSKMSFVLLGKDSKFSVLKKHLMDVNSPSEDKGYSYNYFFIEEEAQLAKTAEKFLTDNNTK